MYDYVTAFNLLHTLQSSTTVNWNIYIATNVAIIGWLVAMKFDVSGYLRLFATVGYFVLVITNYLSLDAINQMIEPLAAQMATLKCGFEVDKGFCAAVKGNDVFHDARRIALTVHAISVFLMVLLIWHRRPMKP